MRIVVTGLSGNIGTALLRRLLDTRAAGGDLDVVGVCRRPPPAREPYDQADWVQLDLADPDAAQRLQPVVRGADAVVHLAWLFQPSHRTDYLERVDVGGSAAVLQACAQARVPHLVHLSSLGVYSPGPSQATARVSESWPRDGIPTLAYSLHKAWVERLLDAHPADRPPKIARIRPALVLQRTAASGLVRYALPAWVPGRLLLTVPFLPLDPRLEVQVVHTDDVAAALVAVLERRAVGAFNLAAEPPVTARELTTAFGARLLPVPYALVRGLVRLTWQLRLQPLDPGWVDLAFRTPLLDTSRARTELGWAPTADAVRTLGELVAGMRTAAGEASAPLRSRSVPGGIRDAVLSGPLGRRRLS